MPLNPTTLIVKDAAAADKSMIAFNDGSKNTFAHAVLDSDGALVNPATAGAQATGNASLATIATNTTGAATAAAQSTGNTSLASIATNTTGVATSANQATGNTSLASIATNTNRIPAQGAALAAASTPVAVATDQLSTLATAANQGTANTALSTIGTNTGTTATGIGAPADAAASTDTGTFSLIALLKRGLQSLTSIVAGTVNIVAEIGKLYQPRSVAATYDGNATMTRPNNTTAYSFGDMVGSDASVASNNKVWVIPFCRANDVRGQITGAKLFKSTTGITNAAYRIYLFRNTFTIAQNDNAAFILPSKADILGILTGSIDEVCADGAYGIFVPKQGTTIPAIPAAGTANIFAIIEAVDAYAPIALEQFSMVLEGFA